MKNKELIAELQALDPEATAYVAVYDCGGYNDIHLIEDVSALDNDIAKVEIYVGCATHRKWTTEGKCPVEKLGLESKKIDDMKLTLNYYQSQMKDLQEQFEKRNLKNKKG